MSNYTKSTNFATKDNLSPGNPLKIVKGTEIDTEFNNIQTAVATKTDGAASSTDNAIARFDSTTGKIIQNSAVTIDDTTGDIVGTATQGVFNTVSTTVNAFGAATAVNIGAATGTATVNNTTLAAKAITASTTLAVTGTSTLTGAVTATAGVTGPITSSSATITGGSISGITDLAVADGGTGASTAAGGLNNLLPSQTGNANKYLQTDGTNASWDAVSLSTADITGTLPVANGGTGVTSSTGTGNVVLSNSPTLVTPALGTPSALVGTNITGTASGLTAGNVTTNANLTGAVTSVGNATSLGSFSSSNLAGALTDETGTGSAVFATSPTLVTPILGTPTSATLTNATGLPIATGVSGLGTGVATALAVNVGSSGAPLVNGGVLGTPSSGTATNLTGLPISTGVSGLGTGVATALAVNVGSSGAPVVNGGALGTPSGGTATNLTGLPLTTGVTGLLPVANGGTATATPSIVAGTNVTVTGTWPNQTINSTASGTGDVVGPASATANGIALFDSTTGKLIKDSAASDGLIYGLTVGRGLGAVSTNTALGVTALFTNTSGSSNLGAGYQALYFNTTGSNNVSVGKNSSVFTTTGGSNVAIGTDALYTNSTSSNSSALGYQAGYLSTGAGNQFFGYSSGSAVTSGAKNTIIGSYTGSAAPISATGSNFVVLSDGDGNIVASSKTAQTFALAGGTLSSGTGIAFPATQSASSDANTLDDYEEGTWTPNQGAGLTVVGTFSSSGSYTKIGRVVTIIATVQGSASVSVSGLGVISSNLPFSSVAGGSAYGTGTAYNNSASTTSTTQAVGSEIYSFSVISATGAIQFTNIYTTST